ncbi:hypothetical protein K1Y78_62900, partial [Streptomyces sp. tea 10]|nr:hypothetical protein [Streptomyces sp. tea 10]
MVVVENAGNPTNAHNVSDIPDTDLGDQSPPCRPLTGIEDVLVVLKTGITEAQEKVPAHVNTTLRCIPHKLVVSDYEEDLDGIRTHDVFRNISQSLLANEDFGLYNRARSGGRAALLEQDNTK